MQWRKEENEYFHQAWNFQLVSQSFSYCSEFKCQNFCTSLCVITPLIVINIKWGDMFLIDGEGDLWPAVKSKNMPVGIWLKWGNNAKTSLSEEVWSTFSDESNAHLSVCKVIYIYLYWGWRHFIQYCLKSCILERKAKLQIIMDEWGVLIALAPPALFRHHEVRHPGDLLPQQGPSSLCWLSGGFQQCFAFQLLPPTTNWYFFWNGNSFSAHCRVSRPG